MDTEESSLGGGSPATKVRAPYGELATVVARNSRPKCALYFVLFALVAAMGVLIAWSAEDHHHVISTASKSRLDPSG